MKSLFFSSTCVGSTKEGGSISKSLMYTVVPTMTDQKCMDYYGKSEITEAMLCAGFSEGGTDSCQGKSFCAGAYSRNVQFQHLNFNSNVLL